MRFAKILFVVVGFLFSFTALVGAEELISPNVDIRLEFVDPPIYNANTGYSPLPQTKSKSKAKWLIAIVTFSPKYKTDTVDGSKVQRWLDDMSADCYILLPSYPAFGGKVLLTGKQRLLSLGCDGAKHRLFFAVPPVFLKQYSLLEKTSKSESSNIPAFVIFRDKNNNRIGIGCKPARGSSFDATAAAFAKASSRTSGIVKVDGAVLPKDKTPWEWLDMDKFDLPKTMSEGK